VSDSNVLGQRTRKVNIDYGLAERVNAEVKADIERKRLEARKRKELNAKQVIAEPKFNPIIEPASPDGKTIYKVSPKPEDQGIEMNFYEWVDHWQTKPISESRWMNAADFYNVSKEIMRLVTHKDSVGRKRGDKLHKSFREDFYHWVLLDTSLDHRQKKSPFKSPRDPYMTKITHRISNLGLSKWKGSYVHVPEIKADLEDALKDNKAIEFFLTLFATDDKPETIIKTMEFISQQYRTDIMVTTRSKESRIINPEATVSLCYLDSSFHIDCSGSRAMNARTRGVKLIEYDAK